jgi:hypothetical protein
MLKFWLSWLQPSLGVLGTALVLSNPLHSSAAPKPVAFNNTSKIPTQPPQWSSAKSTGTTIDRELSSGIAVTPDFAVRQLAINSMVTSGMHPTSFISKTQSGNRQSVANFVSPTKRVQKIATKATKTNKPHLAKNSVAAALARAINPQTPIPVPGLFIGNTDVRVADRFLPNVKPTSRSVSSATEIGAPTPLSAMMAAKTAVDPYPVVRPELMQKLGNPAIAKLSATKVAPHALNPIAAMPSGLPKAATPKTIVPQTAATHSLDPIAAIPSGLQQLLGNNLNDRQPIAATPVAKAVATKPNSVLALKQLVTPTVVPTSVTVASLQLATAQAYTSVPKFSIPGETLLAAKPVKPAVNVLVVKHVQKDLAVAVVERKANYVSLMSDRHLTPTAKQPWTIVNQRNNLGGLILGSQPLNTMPKVVSLVPTSTLKTPTFTGLPVTNLAGIN